MNTEQLTDFCLSLPAAKEEIKFEDHLSFTVGEKIFCITGMHDNTNVSFKIDPDEFDELIEKEGIAQAPYFAKRQWVSVQKRGALKKQEWQEYLTKSYELVKSKLTKKMQKQIDETGTTY